MAATVVSVVIFLCGVLVGRGVRVERASVDVPPANVVSDATPPPHSAPPTPPGSDPTAAAVPPPAVDELSYFNRLEKPTAQQEQLKSTPDRPAAAGRAAAAPPPAPAAPAPPREVPKPAEPPRPAPAADVPASEPAGQGFAVQIAALNVRSEADAIAKRLSSKGYSAYVLAPANGTAAVFRVRVGKF